MMRLPAKALSKPPSEPGGGVIWVKSPHFIAGRPLLTVVQRIHANQKRPKRVASVASTLAA